MAIAPFAVFSLLSSITTKIGITAIISMTAYVLTVAAGIALILGVDRILDMLRTSVNVTGDLTACVVMERWVGDSPDDDGGEAVNGELLSPS